MLCPHCYKDAPLVYRGVQAYCTACGATRVPLSGSAVQLAGQGTKVGGVVAKTFGWIVLAIGSLAGFSIMGLLQWAITEGVLGYLIGGPILLITWIFAGVLLWSGKSLKQTGESAEHAAQEKAILALAENKKGLVGAIDVSRGLDVTLAEADKILTRMAKASPDSMAVDLGEHGEIVYRFRNIHFDNLPTIDPELEKIRVGEAKPKARVNVPSPDDAYAEEFAAEGTEEAVRASRAAR